MGFIVRFPSYKKWSVSGNDALAKEEKNIIVLISKKCDNKGYKYKLYNKDDSTKNIEIPFLNKTNDLIYYLITLQLKGWGQIVSF